MIIRGQDSTATAFTTDLIAVYSPTPIGQGIARNRIFTFHSSNNIFQRSNNPGFFGVKISIMSCGTGASCKTFTTYGTYPRAFVSHHLLILQKLDIKDKLIIL